jgi:hypothetical protein
MKTTRKTDPPRKHKANTAGIGRRVTRKDPKGRAFFAVQKLVDRREEKDGRVLYRVRWEKCPASQDTWTTDEDFCAATYQDARKLDLLQAASLERRRMRSETVAVTCSTRSKANAATRVLKSQVSSMPSASASASKAGDKQLQVEPKTLKNGTKRTERFKISATEPGTERVAQKEVVEFTTSTRQSKRSSDGSTKIVDIDMSESSSRQTKRSKLAGDRDSRAHAESEETQTKLQTRRLKIPSAEGAKEQNVGGVKLQTRNAKLSGDMDTRPYAKSEETQTKRQTRRLKMPRAEDAKEQNVGVVSLQTRNVKLPNSRLPVESKETKRHTRRLQIPIVECAEEQKAGEAKRQTRSVTLSGDMDTRPPVESKETKKIPSAEGAKEQNVGEVKLRTRNAKLSNTRAHAESEEAKRHARQLEISIDEGAKEHNVETAKRLTRSMKFSGDNDVSPLESKEMKHATRREQVLNVGATHGRGDSVEAKRRARSLKISSDADNIQRGSAERKYPTRQMTLSTDVGSNCSDLGEVKRIIREEQRITLRAISGDTEISDPPEAKRQTRSVNLASRESGMAKVVIRDREGAYWAIEKLVGRRQLEDGSVQYRVRWSGCPDSEDTWEPKDNFCEAAYSDARALDREALSAQVGSTTDPMTESCEAECKWTDVQQPSFRAVKRISVDDTDAQERVTEARETGTPVCIVGHRGWTQFAKRWLHPPAAASETETDDLLDLSMPHTLDIDKMDADIGNESVPVLRKYYDESNPTNDEKTTVSSFLKRQWKVSRSKLSTRKQSQQLYLHQWQFPLFETAAIKLCGEGNHHPLPKDILGDDLLKYWLDNKEYNPLQYLFMGGKGTMSKLHRDNGGLLISIAPIVGKKEVVLVHRSDGVGCRGVDLGSPDLDTFPMLLHARLYKTVIEPGEILLMPHGTYHQCRNVTPCLSYSRFHLDMANMKAFVESMLDGDAPEIQHDEVLWNAVTALCDKLNKTSSQTNQGSNPIDPATKLLIRLGLASTVATLEALQYVVMEVVRRLEDNILVAKDWRHLVGDIKNALHSFHCPGSCGRAIRSCPKHDVDDARERALGQSDKPAQSKGRKQKSYLEKALLKAPKCQPPAEGKSISDSVRLALRDSVTVRLHGKSATGTILQVEERMMAAFLRFEGFSSPIDDAFQPANRLRVPVPGDSSAKVCLSDVIPGMLVLFPHPDGEEYRAKVVYCRQGEFYRVELDLDDGRCRVELWVTREWIVEKQSKARRIDWL